MPTLNYKIIETCEEFEALVEHIERQDEVAVDVEADSMFHFKEKVCLIQLAVEDSSYVVDPFKIEDLSPLRRPFGNPAIRKIFHGADYDVRSLYRDYGIVIANLFDTQLASRFVGAKSTGLEAVVQKRFDVHLNKKYQKKDWSERPLPEKMVEYAARDAIYLKPLAEILRKELEETGRTEWVREECELLSLVRTPECNGEPLFLKFKGAGRLNRRRLAVLESILRLRQKIAEEKDRPLFKVFSNDAAMKLAAAAPTEMNVLKETQALSAKQMNMFGGAALSAIRSAYDIPFNELPKYPRKKAPVVDPHVPARVKALKDWRDSRAKKLRVEPSIVGAKAVITSLAILKPKSMEELDRIGELRNWQKKEFGKNILEILNSCP